MKNSASWSGDGSSVLTTTNVVRVSESTRCTALRTLDEPVVHRLEEDEELGDVLEELRAEDAVCELVEGPRGRGHHPRPVGHRQPSQQATAEELGHPSRGVEEVERVARGRRVDDEEVVGARRVDVVQPLHRDVVVAVHEASGDVLVQRVGEDRVAGRGVGSVPAHEVVPRLLRVEHRDPELAARDDTGSRERAVVDASLDVAERLEPERVRETACRVDGEHEDPSPVLRGRHRGGRRRRRRLADSTRAARDDDLLRGEQRIERARRSDRPRHQNPSSSPSASAICFVARRPFARAKSSGT